MRSMDNSTLDADPTAASATVSLPIPSFALTNDDDDEEEEDGGEVVMVVVGANVAVFRRVSLPGLSIRFEGERRS